jgi:hypothetical protein
MGSRLLHAAAVQGHRPAAPDAADQWENEEPTPTTSFMRRIAAGRRSEQWVMARYILYAAKCRLPAASAVGLGGGV